MEDQGYRTNSIEIIFSRNNRFNDYYNEFRKRKHEAKKIKKKNSSWSLEDDEEEVTTKTENSTQNMNLKIVRNPNTPEEIEEIEDDYGEDTIYSAESVPFDILWSVEDALSNSFYRGILLGSPMMNVKIVVCDLKYSIRRSNPMVFQMATVELIKEMYVESQAQLLEPVMDVEISTPNPVIPPLLNDIINVRRGKVGEIVQEGGRFNKQEDGQRSLIHAIIPLEASIGYATYLRTMTKVFI